MSNIGVANNSMMQTTALVLEDAVYSHLATHDSSTDEVFHMVNSSVGNEKEGEETHNPIQIFISEDAHLLRCRPLLVSTDDGEEEQVPTIFGISERMHQNVGKDSDKIPVELTVLEPNDMHQNNCCCCNHPRGDWTRNRNSNRDKHLGNTHSANGANVKIVDLTKLQNLRRRGRKESAYHASSSSSTCPCFDTPGRVFHLLRSLLDCNNGMLHSASPWAQIYETDSDKTSPKGTNCSEPTDQVVALLIKHPNKQQHTSNSDDQFWIDIEEKEVNELLQFRTGDAAPSYFLHSSSQLHGDVIATLSNQATTTAVNNGGDNSTLLLVYRHLPPRDILSHCNNNYLRQNAKYVGCLQETYLEDVKEDTDSSNVDIESDTPPPSVVKQRIVSPPYLSHATEYPGLLDSLLSGIHILQKEAQKIPQWTAWPEQNHYADNCWNVFPLCYTFPANDVTQRKFIHKTCSFVPGSAKLLETLGPVLRTALFSRLDPRAKLGAHTGWSDLANHVLRVHIPLIVPGGKCARRNHSRGKDSNNNNYIDDDDGEDNYNNGLCGTWVDGYVETHDEGRVVCFDDSKVHRAFNYSDEERIVLIIDLARPDGLPMGTATGGHSDELEAFINEIGVG